MAIEPCKPEDCDHCAERPSPHHNLCAKCIEDVQLEFALQSKLTYGTDREGRWWIDKLPDDPSLN